MKNILLALLCLSLAACNLDSDKKDSGGEVVEITSMTAYQGNYDLDGDDISDISPALDDGHWTIEWAATKSPDVTELRIRDDDSLDAPLYLHGCSKPNGCAEFALECTINNNHFLRCEDPAYLGSTAPAVETGSFPLPLVDHVDQLPKLFYLDLSVCNGGCATVTRTIRLN
ncbi:MAG: hypothetical protein MJA28_05935 [Gammaproteobacteria bacterium]|nr:hypothetical protein [Gammaproteobacteria bacterium]